MIELRQAPDVVVAERVSRDAIEAMILELLHARRPGASLCPSEVARELAQRTGSRSWRALMQPVREAANSLRWRRELDVLQKGQPVNPLEVRGPVRLRLPR